MTITRRPARPTTGETERATLYEDGQVVEVFSTYAEARAFVIALPATDWPRYTIKHETVPAPRQTSFGYGGDSAEQ
jgi:hypothetical protein